MATVTGARYRSTFEDATSNFVAAIVSGSIFWVTSTRKFGSPRRDTHTR